jgi:hypothetical protein
MTLKMKENYHLDRETISLLQIKMEIGGMEKLLELEKKDGFHLRTGI